MLLCEQLGNRQGQNRAEPKQCLCRLCDATVVPVAACLNLQLKVSPVKCRPELPPLDEPTQRLQTAVAHTGDFTRVKPRLAVLVRMAAIGRSRA